MRRQAALRRISKYSLPVIIVLALTVFTTAFTFVSAAPSQKPTKITRNDMRKSAKGKHGVSQPASASTHPKVANSGTSGSPIGSSTIPSKPAWVNKPLFADPSNTATAYAKANPSADGANFIARMGQMPVAQWFGDWNGNVTADANAYVSAAANAGAVPILVAYNIPNRDCGGYSVGGAGGLSVYSNWVQQLANGIANRTAVVILEPDALGALDCLPASVQAERTQSLAKAVSILKANPQTSVYIDAGTPVWQSAATMKTRLTAANVAAADGFSLNVSYFSTTAANRGYGDQLSKLIGNKHYVIDTSRNGGNNSPTGMQCNPRWASLGQTPTTNTGSAVNDGLLWIKIPWESDGQCNGDPNPGVGFWSYATQLARNAGW